MSRTRQRSDDPVPSTEVRAEAAAWIARLRNEQRGPDIEAQFRGWLGKSEQHRRAFTRMTQVWEQAGNIRIRARDTIPVHEGRSSRFSRWAPSLAATLILVAVGTVYYWRDGALETGIGQEKTRLLQDGTRIVLNTDTRIEVKYDEHARRVRLIRGEAWFEVSKRPTWPFIVSVGDQEIRALGTSFIVRHDGVQDLSVTLVDGRISVAPIATDDTAPSQAPQFLVPGERLVVSRHQAPTMDRPELSRITAWERGRVEFEETPLKDATTEMNRYNTIHITVPDAEVAQLRIGGVFRAGDSSEFVKIVTAALGLRADRNGHDIVLSRSGTKPLPATAR
jgi:transmembrane sensor